MKAFCVNKLPIMTATSYLKSAQDILKQYRHFNSIGKMLPNGTDLLYSFSSFLPQQVRYFYAHYLSDVWITYRNKFIRLTSEKKKEDRSTLCNLGKSRLFEVHVQGAPWCQNHRRKIPMVHQESKQEGGQEILGPFLDNFKVHNNEYISELRQRIYEKQILKIEFEARRIFVLQASSRIDTFT